MALSTLGAVVVTCLLLLAPRSGKWRPVTLSPSSHPNNLVPFQGGNEQHRSIGFAHKFFSDAAEEPAPDAAATMRGQDEQVTRLGGFADGEEGRAVEDTARRVDPLGLQSRYRRGHSRPCFRFR